MWAAIAPQDRRSFGARDLVFFAIHISLICARMRGEHELRQSPGQARSTAFPRLRARTDQRLPCWNRTAMKDLSCHVSRCPPPAVMMSNGCGGQVAFFSNLFKAQRRNFAERS